MTRSKKILWLQIVGGVAFMLQPIVLPVRPDAMDKFVFSREISKNLLANALILGFFYFNYLVLIPQYYFHKKYARYFLIVVSCLASVLFVSNTFTGQPISPPQEHRQFPPPSLQNVPPPPFPSHERPPQQARSSIAQLQYFFTENDQTFFLFGSIVLFSLLLRVSNRYYKTENAKQEAEINYLLAQINPHFLFNALNSIYTLTIRENATNAASSLLKLSGLLRYVFTETQKNSVPLEKELACISDFIELQKLRLTQNVQLHYVVNGGFSGKQIAPMLLIPFIENAFKHGVSTDEASIIQIKIDVADDCVTLQMKNNKVAINNSTIEKSGLGITNVKSRLQLLYPNKHHLEISEDAHFFNVNLQIFF